MTGRVIRFAAVGDPSSVLTVVQEDTPAPGPQEVLVRIRCRPINPSDLLFVAGKYARGPRLPSGVGFEGAGIVTAVGPGVSIPVGTRCIVDTLGTWRDFMVTHVSNVLPIPDALDDERASQFSINPMSAWLMLEELQATAGAWVLHTAGASALGQCLIPLARERGLRMICTVRRQEDRARLAAIGPDAVIDTSTEDLCARVAELTGGSGVQAVLDAVGGTLGSQTLSCLAAGGVLLSYGMLSEQPLQIPPEALIFKGVQVRGFWLPAQLDRIGPAASERALRTVLAALCRGDLSPTIAARYDLGEVHAAVLHAQRPGRVGKVLLVSADA